MKLGLLLGPVINPILFELVFFLFWPPWELFEVY